MRHRRNLCREAQRADGDRRVRTELKRKEARRRHAAPPPTPPLHFAGLRSGSGGSASFHGYEGKPGAPNAGANGELRLPLTKLIMEVPERFRKSPNVVNGPPRKRLINSVTL